MPSFRNVIRYALLLCAAFAIGNVPVRSQITGVSNDQATPIPGVGHDYVKMLSETVQPSNGQLSIRIDVPTRPGRGITLPFAYLYNSAGVHHVIFTVNGHFQWVSDTQDSQGQGWTTSSPTLSAIERNYTTTHVGPPFYTTSCIYFTNYVFQDATGARHSLPLQTAQSSDPNSPNNCGKSPSPPGNNLTGGDGLYYASTTAPPVDTVPQQPNPVSIVGPDGTVYNFASLNQVYNGWVIFFRNGAASIEDRNGNVVGVGYDTLGGNPNPIAFTANPENVSWKKFSFNSTPQGNLPQANCFGISNANGTLASYSSISLPNGKSYQFQYDSVYGFVNKIVYPTGGSVSYTWGLDPNSEESYGTDVNGLPCTFSYDTPAVTHRYVSFDGVNTALQQDFSYSTTWNGNGTWTAKQTVITTHDCARNNFNCTGAPSFTTTYNYVSDGGGGPYPQVAVEQSIVYKDFNGNVLRTVTKGWNDPFSMVCQLETLDNGKISGEWLTYGPGEQVTDKKEFDYGLIPSASSCYSLGVPTTSPPSGVTPTRETAVTYQSFPPTPIFPGYDSILNRPATAKTYSGSTVIAETDFAYDQNSVTSVSNLPTGTHDETNYEAGSTAPRGNATTITRKCLQNCTNSISTYTFDETGQVLTKTDGCGNASCADMSGTSHTTTYSYSDNFDTAPSGETNAYLTRITNALGQSSSFKYALAGGELLQVTDPNSQTTTYTYNSQPAGCSYLDVLRRLTQVNYPDGGQTTNCYNDATYNASTPSPSVTTTKALTSSTNLTTLTAFDGLGHTVRSVLTSDPDCSTGDRTDTSYDGLGHTYTVSNPYCTTGDQTYGITTYAYDGLGRTTQVTHPDNNTILTSYTGSATQVQDEGNGTQRVTRISQSDALGRLSSVCEVSSATLMGQNGTPASCGLDIVGTGFLTTYQYNVLDNLLQVNQGTMVPRTFAYDSLSRLTSASNPESGTITYSYDANANLSTKKDARSITTTFSYDNLNRNTQKIYSDGTPTSTFIYDVSSIYSIIVTYPVGRFVAATAGCAFTVNAYDQLGRVAAQYQQIPTNCSNPYPRASLSYGYDLAGNTIYSTNGEFDTFTYTYNGAARLTSLTSSVSDSQHPPNLMSAAHYNAL